MCVDLPSKALDALADELGKDSLVTPCDVTDAAGMSQVVSRAAGKFGGLDIVVANAGIERIDPSWIMPADDFERVLEVNIFGVFRSIRPALPYVMERKGHIMAVSSVSALVPWPLCAAYGASKAFVASWMRSLRLELAGTGTTAGAVFFGYIDTDMMKRASGNRAATDMFGALPPLRSRHEAEDAGFRRGEDPQKYRETVCHGVLLHRREEHVHLPGDHAPLR